jgi:hypothetical protein
MQNIRYNWLEDSPVASALFKDVNGSHQKAILFAGEGDHADKLMHIRADLLQHHTLHSYPTVIKGKDALVVYGYENHEDLAAILESKAYSHGAPTQQKELQIETQEAHSIGDTIDEWRHGAMLKAAGVLGLMGHFCQFSTALSEDWKELKYVRNLEQLGAADTNNNRYIVGAAYVVNSGLYTLFGNGSDKLQETKIINDVHATLLEKGIQVDESLYQALQNKRVHDMDRGEALKHTFNKNLVPINEGIAMIANVYTIKEGMDKPDALKYGASGASSLIGSLVAVFCEEKPLDKQNTENRKDPVGWAKSMIQAYPMTFLGLTNLLGAGLLCWDAKDSFKTHQDLEGLDGALRKWSPVAMATFYTAATLLSMASFKGRGDLGVAAFDELFTRVAEETLTIKDPEQRAVIIKEIGQAMAEHSDIDKNITAEQISTIINEKIGIIEKSIWVDTSRAHIVAQAAEKDAIPLASHLSIASTTPALENTENQVPTAIVESQAASRELLQGKDRAAQLSVS